MGRCGAIVLPLMALVVLNLLGHCEMSVYPGLRRKPLQQQSLAAYDMPSDFLAQLMEENARRRLQQQFEQQLELIKMQMARQRQRQERERYRQRQMQLQALQAENEAAAAAEVERASLLGNINRDEASVEEEYGEPIEETQTYSRYRHPLAPPPPPPPLAPAGYEQYESYHHAPMGLSGATREFSFRFPPVERDQDGQAPFAVAPNDPRFYEGADNNLADEDDQGDGVEEASSSSSRQGTSPLGGGDDNDDDLELDSRALDEYEEYVPSETKQSAVGGGAAGNGQQTSGSAGGGAQQGAGDQVLTPVEGSKATDNAAATNFHRIKPQSAAAAAAMAGVKTPAQGGAAGAAGNMRHDINALINKLQKEGKSGAIINQNGAGASAVVMAAGATPHDDQGMVVRQHLGMDGDVGMYVVALIAGVSAAVTVGLIALGFSWVHNRSKAAADVEYPAYGVTGPNKDISPSGDRKLAQSAQMYHYQHQKQQIIAMENRQAVEGGCGLSDVESDDDNEEGDYTVYECPGLAPTGEMEVKNPLFLDETPMTPGNVATSGATPAQAPISGPAEQQQQAQQKHSTQQSAGKKSSSEHEKTANDGKPAAEEEPKSKKKSKK